MTVGDFLDDFTENYQRYGPAAARFAAEDAFHGLLSRAGFFANYGRSHFERDWDLLVLVDACRWDLMDDVVDEYDFVESHSSFVGHASHSREWIHKTFMETPETGRDRMETIARLMRNPDDTDAFAERYDMKPECADVAYITWNVFADMLDEDAFETYVPVGRAKWGDGDEILPPREITDQAIAALRDSSAERAVVHYMQPHTPFKDSDGVDHPGSVWERIQRGDKDYDEAWEEYADNLRWVMDDIELLLENVDADRVVISADHGNAIGEWGCYGHRPYVPIQAVKRVPWVTATASDEGTYTPDVRAVDEADEEEIQERLEALGYA